MFGNPGVGSVDWRWRRKNIVVVRDLPGVPRKWYVKLHRLAEPYFREGLRRALVAGYEVDRFGGFVFRHIRNDSARPLSLHALGIAADVNSQDNYSRTFRRGTTPEAWKAEWNDAWPRGVPRAFVEAMQSVGFVWGSDWDEDGVTADHSYIDPMHFELVQRGGEVHSV